MIKELFPLRRILPPPLRKPFVLWSLNHLRADNRRGLWSKIMLAQENGVDVNALRFSDREQVLFKEMLDGVDQLHKAAKATGFTVGDLQQGLAALFEKAEG